jgi:hypothetical protein
VDRKALARAQAALLRALLGAGPAPAGFPEQGLRLTAAVLARKRRKGKPRGKLSRWLGLG